MVEEAYDYFVSVFSSDSRVVAIERFAGVDYTYLLKEGVRLGIGHEFPEDAVFEVAEDSGDMLTDFLNNISRAVIISERVKTFFQKEGLNDDVVEYLPFKLKDRRGRIVRDRFFYIANVILKVDCLDLEKSDCLFNKNKTRIVKTKLVEIDKDKVPDSAILFRLGEDPSRILFRSDFVDKLKAEGFTGLSLCPAGQKLP